MSEENNFYYNDNMNNFDVEVEEDYSNNSDEDSEDRNIYINSDNESYNYDEEEEIIINSNELNSKILNMHKEFDENNNNYEDININKEYNKLNKKINNIIDEEEDESEDEGLEDYKDEGYHTVFVGEILIDRYVIIEKLGWGHFSTVWLAKDIKYNTYVAIKIQKSAPHYLDAAYDEVEILQKAVIMAKNQSWIKKVSKYKNKNEKNVNIDDCHIIQLLNAFVYEGPFGKHFSMVFEILGINLLEMMKKNDYKGISINQVRKIAKQCLIGLDYLHNECNIIHTDLKPENVWVCLSENQLNNLIKKGQIKKNKKSKNRILRIKNLLKGIEKNGNTNDNGNKENIIDFKEIEFYKNLILTEKDVNREFEIKKSEKKDKYQRKQLKKRLKKKLKKNKKKENFEDLLKKKKELIKKYGENLDELLEEKDNNDEDYNIENFDIKIADLGNGCWRHYHFQPEIQTRQYRSPETILEVKYNHTADIWSLGCMIFEILLSEFIFDPKKDVPHTKNDDHLLQMIETLGIFPKDFSLVGNKWKKFFNDSGLLKRVKEYELSNLFQNLIFNHMFNHEEAYTFMTFLLPMLKIKPEERYESKDLIFHPWLNQISKNNNFQIKKNELEKIENQLNNSKNNDDINLFFDKFYYDKKYNNYTKYLDKNFTLKNEYFEEEDFWPHDENFNEDEESVIEPKDKYEKVLIPFERNFKDTYVGYDSGININLLDNTHNWQFDKKKIKI